MKLAIFDIDGTIADRGVLNPGVLVALRKMKSQGIVTTIATGRAFWTLKKALGAHYEEVFSDDALIILEHGARIVDKRGVTVFAEEFNEMDTDYVVDFLQQNHELFGQVWFGHPDPSIKMQNWVFDSSELATIKERWSEVSDIHSSSSVSTFAASLKMQPVCSVEGQFKHFVVGGNLKLRMPNSSLFMMSHPGQHHGLFTFVKANTNKGLACSYVAHKLGVSMSDVLVAANGINDIEMLDLDVGSRILVGPERDRSEIKPYLSATDTLHEVNTPSDLGHYLQTLVV